MDKPRELPLVGIGEIAQHAGVLKSGVVNWRIRHPDFPTPVVDLMSGPVFWWPEVEQWLKDTGRKTDAGWTRKQVTTNINYRDTVRF